MSPINIPELRSGFQKAGLKGVVELIDFIVAEREHGREIVKIGSGTVDFDGRLKALKERPHTDDEIGMLIMSLPALHLGRSDEAVTPLETLAELLPLLPNAESERIRRLDAFCRDLAKSDESDFEVILGKLILVRPVQ